MVGDNHGIGETQVTQTAQDDGQQQAAQEQPQVSGKDWEKAVAERDEKITAFEAQVAEAASARGCAKREGGKCDARRPRRRYGRA